MELHDILPPLEISDYGFLYILGLIFGVLVIFIYFYKKRKRQTLTPLQILESCNFNDAKKTTSQFSYYGKTLFKEDKLLIFLELNKSLEPYKYTKETTSLPQKLVDEIKELLRQVREEHA